MILKQINDCWNGFGKKWTMFVFLKWDFCWFKIILVEFWWKEFGCEGFGENKMGNGGCMIFVGKTKNLALCFQKRKLVVLVMK